MMKGAPLPPGVDAETARKRLEAPPAAFFKRSNPPTKAHPSPNCWGGGE